MRLPFNRYDGWIFCDCCKLMGKQYISNKVYKQGIFQCQTVKTLDELGENYHYDYTTNEIVYEKQIVVNEDV